MKTILKGCLAIWALSMVLLATQLYGVLQSWGQINNNGRVVAIGVEVNPTHLDWGEVEPNMTVTRGFYVTNTGNSPMTLLIDYSDFTPPEFAQHADLKHNYTGSAIPLGDTMTIEIYLTVNPDIPKNITNFSFNINLWGQET